MRKAQQFKIQHSKLNILLVFLYILIGTLVAQSLGTLQTLHSLRFLLQSYKGYTLDK